MDLQPARSIFSKRLELIPITPPALRALLERDPARADMLLGVSGFENWDDLEDSRYAFELRLGQLTADPTIQKWLLRAMVLRESRVVIGHIGCHGAPDAAYLFDHGLSGIELGYTVFEPYRRQGYAKEAAAALIEWASKTEGVSSFVASISPDNIASLAMARSLGFVKVSSHIDPRDGPEDIYVLRTPNADIIGAPSRGQS